jgi:DNA polymerase III epsilon subunit family exonuclease
MTLSAAPVGQRLCHTGGTLLRYARCVFYAREGPRLACERKQKPCTLHRRYAVIDVETTGFNPQVDRVVEMACAIVDGGRIVSTWSSLVNPRCPIPARVSRVHGIEDRHVIDAPPFELAVRDLLAHCANAIPVAHNASFDRKFLEPLQRRPWLCTVALARRAFPEAPTHGNQKLRAYLGIDAQLDRRIVAHRALDDAIVTAHILMRCLERESRKRASRRREPYEMSFGEQFA